MFLMDTIVFHQSRNNLNWLGEVSIQMESNGHSVIPCVWTFTHSGLETYIRMFRKTPFSAGRCPGMSSWQGGAWTVLFLPLCHEVQTTPFAAPSIQILKSCHELIIAAEV